MTELIAHRGAAFDAPENSLESFSIAIEQGADRIEFDVQLTADGEIVVQHDDTTQRCADRDVLIERASLTEVREARLPNGEPIPTLDEVCALAKGSTKLDVEIKAESRVLTEQVLEIVRSHDMEKDTILTSFHPLVIRAARDAGFTGTAGLIVGSKTLHPSKRAFETWPIRAMAKCGANALAIHHRLIHPLLQRRLRKDRHQLYLWMSIEDEEAEASARTAAYRRIKRLQPAGMIVCRVSEARRAIAHD
ncbi:MAG: glycerophosphoryl diester phosphodiesterase [Bradymonadia bacterium]|jgi:glycerophosphoryl diester phosphodiesterase